MRRVRICAQGAAHGAWKEMIKRVDVDRVSRWEENSSCDVISFNVDMAGAVEMLPGMQMRRQLV